LVQAEVGAGCPAFDLNAACSGFVYALDVAEAYFKAKKVKKILIVSAEQVSKFVDWADRATCVLFGDGAGAVVLSEGDGVLSLSTKAKGHSENLNIPTVFVQTPFSGSAGEGKKTGLWMNGKEIYKFAVTTVTEDTAVALSNAGIGADDVDFYLLHQANGRIIEAARSRLGQPESKFPICLDNTGNTSSASIPILMDRLNKDHRLKKGDILLMSAFGGGLTSGTCIMKWEK
jgi:3-oxoacyl-[acyl-carrier-protein] synthase-3